MTQHYSASLLWSDEDGAYVASCPEFPGLSGVSDDPREALEELQGAIEMALEEFEAQGWELPEARAMVESSGQLRLRLPKSLHSLVSQLADDEGVSLNSWLMAAVAQQAGVAKAQSEVRKAIQATLRDLRAELARAGSPELPGVASGTVNAFIDASASPERLALENFGTYAGIGLIHTFS